MVAGLGAAARCSTNGRTRCGRPASGASTGRIIGDDNAFDDDGLGAGWAWDYLADAYAAPSGALSYNENIVIVRVTPGRGRG